MSVKAAVLAALLAIAAGLAVSSALVMKGSAPKAAPASSARHGLESLPVALQGVASSAVGASNSSFTIRRHGGALRASNPAQKLQMRFGRSGVEIASGASRLGLGLGLRAWGYGSALRGVGAAQPTAGANRASYAYPGIRQWYANGPLGLEQGFTVARQPAAGTAGPLTLSIGLSGNTHAALSGAGQSLTLTHAGRAVLRYGGLLATDARGRALRSWLALEGGRLLLRVDARGAAYPLRIDPLVQQGKKIVGKEEEGFSFFGTDVALSADGNTALVGGPGDGSAGAAWVFTRSGSTWTQQGKKLTASGGFAEKQFGESVALSADGNTALIGGPGDEGFTGAAWVFTRSGSTWTQQGGALTGAEEIGAGQFGWSVAVSADGNTALIGGDDDNEGEGAAWAFTRTGSTWAQQGPKLSSPPSKLFGWSVTLSSDGNTGLVGEPATNEGVGAVSAFTRSGAVWSQQGEKLTGGEESGEGLFGEGVALSEDGDTALVGGAGDNEFVGAAWVFTRSGSTWAQQGPKLTPTEGKGESAFGFSVALAENGNFALIGGPEDNSGTGAAWVFTRSSSTWTQQAKLTGKEEKGKAFFGESVALSSQASTAFVGGPQDAGSTHPGAAWAFANSTPPGCAYSSPKVNVRWHYSVSGSGGWSVTKEAKCAQTLTMGPQAMEGDLKVSPGTPVKAGYDFMLPMNKSPFTASFTNGKVVFAIKCVSGKAPSQSTFTVPITDESYPVSNAEWVPSANMNSPLTFQGQAPAPNACAGGQLTLKQGGTFSTFMTVR